MLTSASACREYILNHTPEELAAHLLKDQRLCIAGRLPSILALYLPYETPLADAIAKNLVSTHRRDIRGLHYHGILRSIKAFLSEFEPGRKVGETDANLPSPGASSIPTTQEFETAIKVLEYLEKVPATRVTVATPLEDIFTAVRLHMALDPDLREAYQSLPADTASRRPNVRRRRGGEGTEYRKCYMCNYTITNPHAHYPSLCVPCGSFNLQESAITLPQNLDLSHKTALVTGGRVNLGFQIALRLLRCGAHVIVSSRYPLDAETRYRAEPSFRIWENRIRVVGADFRTARDAFALVAAVKGVLAEWAQEGSTGGGSERLDILVNNAAQTLTDSVRKEKVAVGRECELRSDAGVGALQVASRQGYRAMVRVGGTETQMFIGLPAADERIDSDNEDLTEVEPKASEETAPAQTPPTSTIVERQQPSSWEQSLNQIPYEDVITAQAVNAFVPLILIRELLPLMGSPRTSADTPSAKTPATIATKPLGYIINISSREGLSESRPVTSIKNGHHVHTNMSKAALNMLTETEAAPAWRERRVAMNSVDPGFMSAADGSMCPIGWEDGAARALWCVAKGETEGMNVWGRFLKHFGGVGAVVRQL